MMLYDIAFIIFSIFYLPFSIYKKGFRSFNIKARLGFIGLDLRNRLSASKNIWIHAVSVGETILLEPFLEILKKEFPDYKVVISTTTQAGNNVAKKIAGDSAVVIYSPLDLSFIVEKFLRIIQPKILIIIETELWPNLIGILKSHGVGIVLINGRISDRSVKRYRMAKLFLTPTLERIDLFCMQSEVDRDRIISLGAPAEKASVTGNMKFDVSLEYRVQPAPASLPWRAISAGQGYLGGPGSTEYRRTLGLGEKDILIVAGSTHKGEEEILLDAYKNLKKEFSNLQLLIAPRHINRISDIEKLAKRKGFSPVRISKIFTQNPACPGQRNSRQAREPRTQNQLFLLDTIGQLKDFYFIADIVFIGGSLIPHGGQNPIEPAYFSKPIIFGPYMFNFKDMAQILLKQAAGIEVRGRADFENAISSLINDSKKAKAMGFFAKRAMEENRGACEKNMELIKRFL